MYLKCVEIQGFKSFADKTKLEFGPGITAVIGPNGCGKSNISDSIRWVLGEQSAKTLRGAKMEDIIFAGSSVRKPLSMAEVSLTVDNSSGILNIPYQEVTVTRRVYRSGESEYLINKNVCRLKDVQNLFNDTGLGKESFALIGQGKVEEVLNSKAEERRALIEETAGIVKYRNRKRETLKKLDETEQNLNRILDIIAELSTGLGPLEIEAEKALQYKTYKTELDNLEIGVAKKKLSILYEKIALLKKEIEDRSIKVEELEVTFSTVDSYLEKEQLEKNLLEEDIAAIQKNIADLAEETSKLEHLLAVSEERKGFNAEQRSRLEEEIKKDKERLSHLQGKYTGQISEHQQLQEQIAQEQHLLEKGELKAEELQSSCKEIAKHVDKLKNDVFDVLQTLASQRNKYNQICYEKDSFTQKISRNSEKFSNLQNEIREINANIAQAEENLQKKHKNLIEVSDLIKALKHEKIQVEIELKKLEDILDKNKEEIHVLTSKQQALMDLENDYEGYFQGVKAVLKAKTKQEPSCQGIVGAVGELITVPVQYEQAIETALGSAIQNLVALSDKAAEDAINYLKLTHGGRATFLPLNTIKIRELNKGYKHLLKEKGVIGLAADLVNIESKYQKILNHLLGNILVTDNLATARSVSKKVAYTLKIVTLDGDIINPGGSLTGGSQNRKNKVLLSRPRQIRELNKTINIKKEELGTIEQKVFSSRNNLNKIIGHLEKLEKQIQKECIELATLEQTHKNALQGVSKISKEAEFLQEECSALTNQLNEYRHQEVQLKRQIADLERQNQALEKEYNERQKMLKTEEENIRLFNEEVTLLKVKLAGLLEKEKAYQNELIDYYKNEREIKELLKSKFQELTDLDEQKKELQAKIKQNNMLLEQALSKISLLKNKQSLKASDLNNLKDKIERLSKEQKAYAKKLNELKEELHEKKVLFARLETEKKNEEVRLEEKFGLTYDDIKVTVEDSSEILDRIKNLKKQIAKLGDVNLAAIEEFKRKKERHDFLKKQEEDLSEAKSVLNKVILEVDQVMIKRFTEAFKEVNSAFGDIYQRLFGGGIAQLKLTDPNDLLETGVDIEVQPPGKKLQNLTLLSGGERALTVIALLFALLSCKPSPFCVLDEIEASLDETNVERFASFLKLFTQKTQFVVISHRQGTIEVADALYGVTMEESGVSKIISVKLTEGEGQESRSA